MDGGVELPAGGVLAPECLLDEPGLRVLHRSVTTYKTPHAVALFRSAALPVCPSRWTPITRLSRERHP